MFKLFASSRDKSDLSIELVARVIKGLRSEGLKVNSVTAEDRQYECGSKTTFTFNIEE